MGSQGCGEDTKRAATCRGRPKAHVTGTGGAGCCHRRDDECRLPLRSRRVLPAPFSPPVLSPRRWPPASRSTMAPSSAIIFVTRWGHTGMTGSLPQETADLGRTKAGTAVGSP